MLEPFGHISVVCTATEWDNFFELRCHPDADPTMRALAEAMRDAINVSEPEDLGVDDWHLPYISDEEMRYGPEIEHLTMISAARCARVSYLNHDGTEPDIQKDLALADRLLSSKHMSPFEHQARVTDDEGTALWGNFRGWDQFRKMVE
jgi:thymidylate synthase ThyX